jgi:hypothetical protein
MKIKLEYIENNPYRDLEKFPLVEDKIEQLVEIIESTRFYNNIFARPHPNKDGFFQIAYGHHRLEALRRIGIKSIDIPVDELSDAEMIQAMVADNMKDYDNAERPIIAIESVRAAKNFLDSELAKYDSWEDFERLGGFTRSLFNPPSGKTFKAWWKNQKSCVGHHIIRRFLHGAMKEWKIKACLGVIKNSELFDDKTVNLFNGLDSLNRFKKNVIDANEERVENNDTPLSKEDVYELAVRLINQQAEDKKNKKVPASKDMTNRRKREKEIITQEISGEEAAFDEKVNNLISDLNDTNKQAQALYNQIAYVNTRIIELGIDQMDNVPIALSAVNSFGGVFSAAGKMFSFFGIDLESELIKLQEDGTQVY